MEMKPIVREKNDASRVPGDTEPFILASASPRREDLLKKLLNVFIVSPQDINEKQLPGEPPKTYVLRVSREKADTACREHGLEEKDAWVLAADTIVVLGSDILGKPGGKEEARKMLDRLQDRDHEVITGICLINQKRGIFEQDAVKSRVWMRRLDPDEVEAYIASGEPFDKAGGYAIQGRAGRFILRVEGSYTNVVGLPLEDLEERFQRLGIS
jgi:septum formation protein